MNDQQRRSTSARASDHAAINAALDDLDAEIARFDAIVRNKFAADPATLAAWELVRHRERTPRKRRSGKTSTVAPAQS